MKYFNITIVLCLAIIGAIFLLPPPQNSNAACNPPYECEYTCTTNCESGSFDYSMSGGGSGCPGETVTFTAKATHNPGTTTEECIDECCEDVEPVETDNDEITDFDYKWSVSPDAPHSAETGENFTITPTTCGVYTVTVTTEVNDECSGEPMTLSATNTFSAEDDTPPEFSDVPTNITVECHSDIPAEHTLTATDNCDDDKDVECDQQPAEITTNDCIYIRTWKTEDTCGNLSTTTQVITVESDPPEILDVPEDITINCPGEWPPTNSLTARQCGREWSVECDSADAPDLDCGIHTNYLTWTTDGICSGSTVVTQKIIYIPRELSAPLYDEKTYKPVGFDYEPCGELEWSFDVMASECGLSPKLANSSPSSSGDIILTDDSGSGTVTVTVTDTGTGCSASCDVHVGCKACSGGSCSVGGSTTELCSWMFEVGLGNAAKNSPVGPLKIYALVPTPEIATPAGLVFSGNTRRRFVRTGTGKSFASTYAASFRAKAIYNTNGLRQVWAPECLANIIVETPFKYRIDIYSGGSLYQRLTGYHALPVLPDDDLDLYTPNGPLVVSYTIENPNGTNSYNTLHITENRPGDDPKTTIFSYNQYLPIGGGSATPTWSISEGGDARKIESLSTQTSATEKVLTRTISNQIGEVASQSTITKQNFPWGFSAVTSVTGSGAESLTKTYSYYTTETNNTSYGQKKLIVNTDGSWERYDSYDGDARETVVVSSWGDQDTDAAASSAKAIYYSYAPVDAEDTITESKISPRTTTVKIEDTVVEQTYNAYYLNASNQLVEITERAYSASAPYGDLLNQRTTRIYNSVSTNAGSEEISSISTSDGMLDTYTYDYGIWTNNLVDPGASTFVTTNTGLYVRSAVTHGTTNSPAGIANKTTRDITIEDSLGRTLMSESYVYTGGTNYQRIAWTVNELNSSGKPIVTYNSNGTTTETAWASCGCGKDSQTDAQGLTTDYQYDDLNRLDFSSRELGTNNIITTYTYDAVGHRLTSTTTAGSITMPTTTNTYDLAGRRKTATDTLGITTTYSYGANYSQTVRAGVTNKTVNYLDGRTHYTEQNGVRKQTYTYGVNADGTQWTKVYTGPDGTNSLAWSKTTTDMLGRTIKSERPGFGDTLITSESFYNDIGQLTNATMTGQADTLYEYNELGQQIRTAQDINENGTIDLDGTDRITESDSYYEEINSDYWMTSISKIYAQNNSSAVTTNSIRKNRLTGLSAAKTSESISKDILGNETTNTTFIDRSNKVRVGLVSTPDSIIDAVSTTINGLLDSSKSKTGLTTTYAYDALGRRIGTTDPRIGESITHYNAKGQVDYTEDAATNRTIYVYDSATGRRTSVANALDEATHSHYSSEGQLLGTYGNTYPVFYEYDAYDRMSAMYTLRDTNIVVNSYSSFMNNTSSFDKTSWLYDEPTGLLTNKVYDDGKGPSYTYYPNGQLYTRTWARGVTTTNTYTIAGELSKTEYSDDTASVQNIYNRLGQQLVVIKSDVGIEVTSYNQDTFQPAYKMIGYSGYANRFLHYTYDSLGRQTGYSLSSTSVPGTDEIYHVSHSYDNYGRFHSVLSSVNSVSSVVDYSYLENSYLIAGYTSPNGFEVTREYEPNRNLITEIKNQFDNTTISRYNYTNDEIGRRTQRIDTMANTTTNTFGYNNRSELIAAALGLDDYGYNYDQIGNRITATSSADSVTSEMDYLSNALNQYTNISYGQGSSLPSFDADGNMLTNGDWTYTWNGENRLTTASNATTIVNFKYDYMGRRFEKSVEGSATKTFIYDGWNPIAEFSTGDSQVAPSTNYYTWGLDLSGSLQGAGGIGGLLSAVQDGDIYFSCFDANGNITDYTDETGDIVAHYEYNPFGGITSATGDKKDDFNFRFSTKYLDKETGFYYYGYRYYLPELGRWINRDPIGERGGVDLYSFVENIAGNTYDILGMFSEEDAVRRCQGVIDMKNGDGFEVIKPLPSDDVPQEQCQAVIRKANKNNRVKNLVRQFGEGCTIPYVVCGCCDRYQKSDGTDAGAVMGQNIRDDGLKIIKLCWNNRHRGNLSKTLAHELTHALQGCKSYPDDCAGNLKKEIQARICAGQCYGFDDCLKKAINSSCGNHCKDSSELTKAYADVKKWYQDRDRKLGDRFASFCSFYPEPPIPPTPNP